MDLSFIIPVYNAENTIESCLINISRQETNYTYEVIAVDDGSTDGTMEVLNELKKRFPWLVVVHQQNAKQAVARNKGIRYAHGKYLSFIDADDLIETTYVEKMLTLIESRHYSLSICGIRKRWVGTARQDTVENTSVFSDTSVGKTKIVAKYLNRNTEADVGLWNKVFLRSIIVDSELQFRNKNFFEDMLFNLEYFLQINPDEVIITNEVLYTLFKRKQSSTTTRYDENMDVLTKNFFSYCDEILHDKLEKDDQKINKIMDTLKVRLAVHTVHYHLVTDKRWTPGNTKECIRQSVSLRKIFTYYDLPLKYKVSVLIMRGFPKFYRRLYLNKQG